MTRASKGSPAPGPDMSDPQASDARASGAQTAIFREEALARQGESENLSQLLRVTSSRSWIVLAGLAVVLAAVLGWGLLGSVEERITLGCVIVEAGDRHLVATPATGSLTELATQGDFIEADDRVAQIWSAELDRHIDLISPSRGEVTAIDAVVGQVVSIGEEVAWIRDGADGRFEALTYVTAGQARLLRPTMEVNLIPISGGEEAHPVAARVEFVQERPTAAVGWLTRLGLPATGQYRLVRMALDEDPDWQVLDGDRCRADIVLERRAPFRTLGVVIAPGALMP